MRRFVAPGKIVVLGEYAVLDGAPAVVAAVESGVACTWHPASGRHTTSDVGDTTFVDAALTATNAPGGRYAFASHKPPRTETKPGLGGSAAATVVATYAALTLAGRPHGPEDVFRTAYAVHHEVQGSGSGVDVAASTTGGVLRYVRGEPGTPLPAVDMVVVWSGQSARTGPRVRQYLSLANRQPFVDETLATVDGFADSPVEAMQAAHDALHAMAKQAGIAYATPALDRIAALARAHGGAGKPSGAGGGDCAIAVFPATDQRDAFIDACRGEGFGIVSSTLAPGVHEVL